MSELQGLPSGLTFGGFTADKFMGTFQHISTHACPLLTCGAKGPLILPGMHIITRAKVTYKFTAQLAAAMLQSRSRGM